MTASAGLPAGVLITNLGTPPAPTEPAVRRYLAEFLSDRRVIGLPPMLWQPILRGVVLRVRPKRSAALYRKVWTEAGSPLLVYSQKQRDALQDELTRRGHRAEVVLGMRYGQPSIAQALDALPPIRSLVMLPLYPQFSNATTASSFDALRAALAPRKTFPITQIVSHYAHHPGYIAACAEHIRAHREDDARQLILSFHGLPRKSIDQGDPYAQQCRETARKIAQALDLPPEQWRLCFQSRFGYQKWLTPYLDETLRALPGRGIRAVDVFCPGFAADCLETLEEIEQENRAAFEQAGGEIFRYIPALNDRPAHIRVLADLLERHLP